MNVILSNYVFQNFTLIEVHSAIELRMSLVQSYELIMLSIMLNLTVKLTLVEVKLKSISLEGITFILNGSNYQ